MNKRNRKEYMKAYYASHKEQFKAYNKAHKTHHNEYMNDYYKFELNALGQLKQTIRQKSLRILKQMNLHINDYEIHHCFGYEDASKFIYCSKSLHQKIHQFLRDNKINAGSNHWMAIRDIVNRADEFIYIKC